MLNYIYIFIVIISIIFALFTGNIESINNAILQAPLDSLNIFKNIAVSLIFYSGILEIAKKSGLLDKLTFLLKKILKPLFKNINDSSLSYIAGNVASNMLGLGNSAMPFGLKAMEELQKINQEKEKASKEMITLLILNTSGLTLIPSTILSIRKMYNANVMTEIIPIIVVSSIITSIVALFLDYLFRKGCR